MSIKSEYNKIRKNPPKYKIENLLKVYEYIGKAARAEEQPKKEQAEEKTNNNTILRGK